MSKIANKAIPILAAAFADDPVMRWVFPNATQERLHLLWSVVARGTVDVGDGVAAIWRAPGEAEDDSGGEALAALSGDELTRLGALGAAMAAAHPTEPHWYLLAIGTEPAFQGQGRGAALLAEGLERAAGFPAYLESSNPRNESLYRRHGFEATGTITAHGGPPLTTMWR